MCEVCIRICNAIGELTSEEGESVTIHCGNVEFSGPNRAIDYNASYPNFDFVRFEGDSLVECLENAVNAKKVNTLTEEE